MDVEILARLQFAITIMFHYIYPPLSIGLGLMLVIIEGIYIRTQNPVYLQMAKFWTRVFALTFAIGVATGIVMEFEFGTNWSHYSRYVGDVFGSALAAEGIFAFFLESGFLAVVLFGWTRVRPRVHYFATIMVALGAHFSAIWIIVANSWMQTPAGFQIVGEGLAARAEITDFWAMVFNPSSVDRLVHSIIGAWLAGAFLVISVSAFYILLKRHLVFAKNSLKIGLYVASIALVLQVISGDRSGEIVAKYQPSKLAAYEALYQTEQPAAYNLIGVPDSKTQTLHYKIAIPKLLSFLAFKDANAEVKGLDQFPREDWPNVPVLFFTFRTMIAMWVLMVIACTVAIYYWRKGLLFEKKWALKLLIFSAIFPQIANQAGWVSAEMGRYPWIVFDLLRISEGLSKSVTANQVFGSIIMFGIVYTFLFILFVYLLNEKFQHGPTDEDLATPYHHLHRYVEEIKND
ncbi:Cytochrome bd ubiquinol oxidase subunit 1 [Chlamydiales bacterium STE3]|nr:Cytochrome bd ubiquinol oxidase subunit 1 [Chlamydiales bacterium STE3]